MKLVDQLLMAIGSVVPGASDGVVGACRRSTQPGLGVVLNHGSRLTRLSAFSSGGRSSQGGSDD
jgi:hypothetical protein